MFLVFLRWSGGTCRYSAVSACTLSFASGWFGITLTERIPAKASWATADRSMISHFAISVHTAGIWTWVDTLEVVTISLWSTIRICLAFSTVTLSQSVTNEPTWTCAYRPFVSSIVTSWCANCVGSTRIGGTEISWSEWSTFVEWMTSEASWARADSLMIRSVYFTFSPTSTGSFTWISTLQSNTS